MTVAAVEAPFDLRAAWHRWRLLVVLIVVGLGVAVGLAVVENAPPQRPLDPRDASPVGARALAVLLQQRGVDVVATTAAASVSPTTTVFVPDPRSLTRARLSGLATTATDIVVVAPGSRELDALGIRTRPTGATGERTIPPSCSFEPAVAAGAVRFSGLLYAASRSLTACYPGGTGAGMLVDQHGGRRVVVLGSGQTLTNAGLRDEGDAALGLGLLSTHPQVTWILPRPPTQAPADARHRSIVSLLPDRLLWALLQLVVVVVLVGLWRARRIGPVVEEPLPVVVRAAETVRGRAGLLRAARARDTAAAALREGSVRRICDLVGLGPQTPPTAVVAATTRRVARPESSVAQLLYGGPPPDDASLVRLADDLDALESEVRRT